MFWIFGRKACGILALWPGIEPKPSVLEEGVITTGPPGKSLEAGFQFPCQRLKSGGGSESAES